MNYYQNLSEYVVFGIGAITIVEVGDFAILNVVVGPDLNGEDVAITRICLFRTVVFIVPS